MHGIIFGQIDTSIYYKRIIVIASGPSLHGFDFNSLNNKDNFIIAVNDAGKYIPWANAWFTLDPWGTGQTGKQLPSDFSGKLYAAVPEDYAQSTARCTDHRIYPNPNVTYLRRLAFHTSKRVTMNEYNNWGLSDDCGCIKSLNSGYGALNFAYLMNPEKILLLGIDATRGYFFDKNKSTRSLNFLPMIFSSALPQLNKSNIKVYNGSIYSKIKCFPRYSIDAALENFYND